VFDVNSYDSSSRSSVSLAASLALAATLADSENAVAPIDAKILAIGLGIPANCATPRINPLVPKKALVDNPLLISPSLFSSFNIFATKRDAIPEMKPAVASPITTPNN